MEMAARAGDADPPAGAQRLRRARVRRRRCSASASYLRQARRFATRRGARGAPARRSTRRSASSPTRSGATSREHSAVQDRRAASACTTIRPSACASRARSMLDVVLWQRLGQGRLPGADPARRGLRPAARQSTRGDMLNRGAAAKAGKVTRRRSAGVRPRAGADGRRADRGHRGLPLPSRRRRAGEGAARTPRRAHDEDDKIVSADDAIAIIRDGDTVSCSGFVGIGTPEELIEALERRFLETQGAARPHAGVRGGAGRRQGARAQPARARGPGQARDRRPLVARAQARRSWRPTTCIEAYNLPLGVISHLFRDIGRAPRRHADQGRAAHLRRSAPRRRQDQRAHHRGPGARDGDRRRGVAVLQDLPDQRRVDPRHHRRRRPATSRWSARR